MSIGVSFPSVGSPGQVQGLSLLLPSARCFLPVSGWTV